MTVYDWGKVSRETLERLAQSIHTSHAADVAQDAHLQERLADARAEGLAPPQRTRAEVDAEIAGRLRSARITNRGSSDRLFIEGLDAVAFIGLCTEPVAIQTAAEILDGEFPEAAPDECERGGDCIESITRPGFCAKCERDMPRRVSGEAAPEACSCEESERLKARVRELEADRDHFKGIWQVECDRTVRALKHQETAEGQARALRERVEKAVAVLSTGQCRNCCPEALRFLRG